MPSTLATAAADLLLAHGPLTLPALHEAALAVGATRATGTGSLVTALRAGPFVLAPDGRWNATARLLRGQVFTTRARGAEDRGLLWCSRDLDPLRAVPRLRVGEDGEVRVSSSPVECWAGPVGWLPARSRNDLLGLTWTGHCLQVQVLGDVPAADSPEARAVREVLHRHARTNDTSTWEPVRPSLMRVVASALVEDPGLFSTPLPPLGELLPLGHGERPRQTVRPSPSGPTVDVRVPLSLPVLDELSRRAELLGDPLPDHLRMLLTSAADRVRPGREGGLAYDLDHDPVVLVPDRWLD